MKKTVAFISVIFILISLIVVPVNSVDEYDPIVYVTGFLQGTLTKDKGKSGEEDVMAPDAKIIAKAMSVAVPGYTAFRFSNDYEALAKTICDTCEVLFDGIRFDKNGESVYDISLKEENVVTAEQPYGKCNYFFYDWRKDVTETADLLDEYINSILKATNKTKVALFCSSMGGCVGTAYITEYGSEKLSSIIMSSSAAMGVDYLTDMLCGKLDLDYKTIYNYLVSLDIPEKINLPDSAMKMVNLFGYNTILSDIAKAVSENENMLHERLVTPILSRFPGIWSLVKQSSIPECKKTNGVITDSPLEKKIDNYLFNSRLKLVKSLYSATENGVKLAILSSYNLEAVPHIGKQTYQSDNLIATSETSLGATCAKLGSSFADNYNQHDYRCHYHVSPDRIIDASTCAFPDNTWFVKDAAHTLFDSRFIYWVAYTEDEINVYSNSKYPQFMQYENKRYSPIEYESTDLLPSFRTMVNMYIRKAVKALYSLVKLLSGRK